MSFFRMPFFVLIASLSAMATSAFAEIVADEEMHRGKYEHFLTRAMLNGKGPFTVLIDTGSNETILMDAALDALDIPASAGRSVNAHGAAGNMDLKYYKLEEIALGGLTAKAPRVLGARGGLEDLVKEGVAVVIGIDIIGDYIVEFDQTAGRFRLHSSDSDMSEETDGWLSAEIKPGLAGLSFTTVSLNGAEMPALFDTGASRTIINLAAAEAAGYTHGDPRLSPGEKPVRGFGGEPAPSMTATGAKISWGGLNLEGQSVTISQASAFDLLRMSEGPGMIAGAPLFGDRDFVVDYEKGTVFIGPKR